MKKEETKLIITMLIYSALTSVIAIYLSLTNPVKDVVFDVENSKMVQMSKIEFNYFALGGMTLSLLALGSLLDSCNYGVNDFGECTNKMIAFGTGKINSFFVETLQLIFTKKVKRKILVTVNNLAPFNLSGIIDKSLSDEELLELTKRSLFILCRSRGGKTTFLKYYLYTLLKNDVKANLAICDINYGKPSDDGVINNWMGISSNYIHSGASGIYAAIKKYGEELKERKSICEKAARSGIKGNPISDKPINLLVIEELIASKLALESAKMWDDCLKTVSDGLVCGLGYGCPIVIVSQSLAVSETGINLAMRDQFNIIALGKSSSSLDVIKDCGFDEPQEIRAHVQAMVKSKRRPILITGVDDSKVSSLPDLRWIDDVEVMAIPAIDEDKEWWNTAYVNNIGNQEWLQQRVINYFDGIEKSITSSDRVKELNQVFGIKPSRQDNRYVNYFKPELERLIEVVKNENRNDT
jgi:hypothetical protein